MSTQAAVMITLVVLFACTPGKAPTSGDAGRDGGVDAGSPADVSCASEAQALCTLLQMCEPGALAGLYGSVAACEAQESAACVNSQEAPGTGQSVTNVDACASSISSETCADVLAGTTPPACEPPIGQGAIGAACAFDGQCASQFCNVPPNTLCGTCADQPTAGTACSATGCGATMICEQTMSNGNLCETPVGMGQNCDQAHPCGTGFSCVATSGMPATASCVAFATTVGAMCSPEGHTAPKCDDRLGLACGPGATCESVTFADAGDACGAVDGGLVGCEANGTCNRPSGQMEGICAAAPMDNTTCDSTATNPCPVDSRCIVTSGTIGTCEVPSAASCM